MSWHIRRNSERYKGLVDKFPDAFTVDGCTLEEAIEIAAALANYHAGCDYAFYVEEDPETTA